MRIYAVPAVLALAAALSGCGGEGRAVDLTADLAQPAAAVPAVDPSAAGSVAGTGAAGLERPAAARGDGGAIPGILVAGRKAAIGSQLTGQVDAVLVQEGDPVRAGQEVIRLDSRALHLETAAAGAAL